jgi:hypothetical protein
VRLFRSILATIVCASAWRGCSFAYRSIDTFARPQKAVARLSIIVLRRARTRGRRLVAAHCGVEAHTTQATGSAGSTLPSTSKIYSTVCFAPRSSRQSAVCAAGPASVKRCPLALAVARKAAWQRTHFRHGRRPLLGLRRRRLNARLFPHPARDGNAVSRLSSERALLLCQRGLFDKGAVELERKFAQRLPAVAATAQNTKPLRHREGFHALCETTCFSAQGL